MTILLDTSALLAYFYERDKNHTPAVMMMNQLGNETLIVPSPVLSELFYMLSTPAGYKRAILGDAITRRSFSIVPLDSDVFIRMEAIMNRYLDAEFDYADTAIMALAERLKISRVFTFDRRDFTVYRPTHADALTLLP